MKFREKKTDMTWYIHNVEHIKSFLLNKNFEQIKEEEKVSNKNKTVENKKQEKILNKGKKVKTKK